MAFHDLGAAIVLLTIAVRLVLAPMYHKMLHQQVLTQKIGPEMMKIREDHKDDKEKQTQLLMELYKRHKINPFYTFLVLLIQLPVMWGLFKVFTSGLNGQISSLLYPFISDPGTFNPIAFGLINLNERNIVLIIFTALIQFIQTKISSPSVKNQNKTNSKMPMLSGNMMGVFLALFSVFILWKLPSAVALYWLVSTIFAVGQQFVCNRKFRNAELKGNNN
ncbi:MAG: YidC/Oxa1 family membrane protein insertase [Parcubacteria group bacterium]